MRICQRLCEKNHRNDLALSPQRADGSRSWLEFWFFLEGSLLPNSRRTSDRPGALRVPPGRFGFTKPGGFRYTSLVMARTRRRIWELSSWIALAIRFRFAYSLRLRSEPKFRLELRRLPTLGSY